MLSCAHMEGACSHVHICICGRASEFFVFFRERRARTCTLPRICAWGAKGQAAGPPSTRVCVHTFVHTLLHMRWGAKRAGSPPSIDSCVHRGPGGLRPVSDPVFRGAHIKKGSLSRSCVVCVVFPIPWLVWFPWFNCSPWPSRWCPCYA